MLVNKKTKITDIQTASSKELARKLEVSLNICFVWHISVSHSSAYDIYLQVGEQMINQFETCLNFILLSSYLSILGQFHKNRLKCIFVISMEHFCGVPVLKRKICPVMIKLFAEHLIFAVICLRSLVLC